MTNRLIELEKMLQEDPTDSFLIYAIALEKEKAGNAAEAAELIQQLHDQNPEDLSYYHKLADIYFNLDEQEKAVSIIELGVEKAEQQQNQKVKNELEQLRFLKED